MLALLLAETTVPPYSQAPVTSPSTAWFWVWLVVVLAVVLVIVALTRGGPQPHDTTPVPRV